MVDDLSWGCTYGFELAIDWAPRRNLRVNSSYSYIHTKSAYLEGTSYDDDVQFQTVYRYRQSAMVTMQRLLTCSMDGCIRRLGHLGVFCCLILFAQSQANAATPSSGSFADYKIKAVYVYHFANFVRWPDPPPASIRFCTLGRDSVTVTLQQLINNKNRPNTSASITALSNLDDASGNCEILYITDNKLRLLQRIPQYAGMLTVSDSKHFLHNGGMIELRSVSNRVKPAIALDNVEKGQLTISSQLLRVALLPSDLTGGDHE